MRVEITTKLPLDITHVDIIVPIYEEDFNDIFGTSVSSISEASNSYPLLFIGDDLYLHLNVDTGVIENWPETIGEGSFRSFKIVDAGKYVFHLATGDAIATEGYVPDFLEVEDSGWGDYFEFTVDETGKINDWDPFDEDFAQYIEKYAEYVKGRAKS